MRNLFLTLLAALALGVSSLSAQTISKTEVMLGFDNGISYQHSLSDHFVLRCSGGLTLDHRIIPDIYKLDEEGHRVTATTRNNDPKSCNYFRLTTMSYSIAPFAAVDVRWYPRPEEGNTGFFLYGSMRYIHNGLPIAKLQDYDPYDIGQLLFPVGLGYDVRLSDRFTLSLTGDMGLYVAFEKQKRTGRGVFMHESLSVSYRF